MTALLRIMLLLGVASQMIAFPSELRRSTSIAEAGAVHGDGFESYALGSDTLCDHHTNYNYRCLRGMDKGQDGAPFPTVVSAPEPVRSGKHSLRSGPFTYEEGYRVEGHSEKQIRA